MDSKLKRTAILLGILVIIAITGGVAAYNYLQTPSKFNALLETVGLGQYAVETASDTAAQEGKDLEGQTVESSAETEVSAGIDLNGADMERLSAFMKDETFFDQDYLPKSYKTSETESEEKSLTMLVSSAAKDLRIKIIDDRGNLVKGISFYINIKDVGEYKDLDQDGIIYVGELRAGDYYVTMAEVEGYITPQIPLKATVKDNIDYTVLEDISYLIKTEDEIDAALEDSEAEVSSEDIDDTEVTGKMELIEGEHFGIDVSKWNKEIDWEKVKADGVEFAIIRVGYRGSSTGALVEDPYFRKNIEGAQKAGVPVGIYFFTQAVTAVEAVEEASMAIELCKEYQLNYPVFIDTEGAGGNGRADGLDKESRTVVCEAFCQTVENAGYGAGVYASRNWYYNNVAVERLEDYTIWVAEYRSEPLYNRTYDIWQYTSNGSVDGIEGRVDLNLQVEND